jgi:hypothetical protein
VLIKGAGTDGNPIFAPNWDCVARAPPPAAVDFEFGFYRKSEGLETNTVKPNPNPKAAGARPTFIIFWFRLPDISPGPLPDRLLRPGGAGRCGPIRRRHGESRRKTHTPKAGRVSDATRSWSS